MPPPCFSKVAASAGTTVSESSSAAHRAKVMVSATGANSRPSSPCSDSSGRKTVTMMTTPETSGTATSRTASPVIRMRVRKSVRPCAWAKWCAVFSTTTTEQSTSRPMAIARPPSDMMLAEIPVSRMTMKVDSTASGRMSETTSAARRLPRKRISRTTTSAIASSSTFCTVQTAFSISSLRS